MNRKASLLAAALLPLGAPAVPQVAPGAAEVVNLCPPVVADRAMTTAATELPSSTEGSGGGRRAAAAAAVSAAPAEAAPSAASAVAGATRPPVAGPQASVAATPVVVETAPPPEPCLPRQSPDELAGALPAVDLPLDPAPPPPPPPSEDGLASIDSDVTAQTSYLVINNAAQGLYCAVKWPGAAQAWSAWFKLDAGKEWGAKSPPKPKHAGFFCHRPLDQAIHVLQPGRRYSVQPDPDRAGTLRIVDVDAR